MSFPSNHTAVPCRHSDKVFIRINSVTKLENCRPLFESIIKRTQLSGGASLCFNNMQNQVAIIFVP